MQNDGQLTSEEENMNILEWTLLGFGIIVAIVICTCFIVILIKSSAFEAIGFRGSKEELYDITFQKFDFDHTIVSGTDSNENQENMISEAIEQIDKENTPVIEQVDYYA